MSSKFQVTVRLWPSASLLVPLGESALPRLGRSYSRSRLAKPLLIALAESSQRPKVGSFAAATASGPAPKLTAASPAAI